MPFFARSSSGDGVLAFQLGLSWHIYRGVKANILRALRDTFNSIAMREDMYSNCSFKRCISVRLQLSQFTSSSCILLACIISRILDYGERHLD